MLTSLFKQVMKKLPKYSLSYNERKEGWALKNDNTERIIKTFITKESATKGGVLEKALGDNGGSVKIKNLNGKIQEDVREIRAQISSPRKQQSEKRKCVRRLYLSRKKHAKFLSCF